MNSTTEIEIANWRDCRPLELTKILQHSSEAFYEHGFHGTTVRDIANRVGVTVPALYYHHENKEGILAAVLEAAMADLIPRVAAAVADAGDDVVLQISNLVECTTMHLTVRSRVAALDSEYRYLSGAGRAHYAELRRHNELLTRSIISRGVDQGVFAVVDVNEAARAILGMLQAIPRWYVAEGPLTPADVAERYKQLSLSMLGCAGSPPIG